MQRELDSREQELQADQLGAEYLTRVQRDPRHMVRVIEVLRSQERYAADRARAEGRQPPTQSWLATHPAAAVCEACCAIWVAPRTP